jgi:hypothetical protein
VESGRRPVGRARLHMRCAWRHPVAGLGGKVVPARWERLARVRAGSQRRARQRRRPVAGIHLGSSRRTSVRIPSGPGSCCGRRRRFPASAPGAEARAVASASQSALRPPLLVSLLHAVVCRAAGADRALRSPASSGCSRLTLLVATTSSPRRGSRVRSSGRLTATPRRARSGLVRIATRCG